MQHLTKIHHLMDEGKVDQAKSALENLLVLGPNNLEGLKLRALIYAAEGRFQEELQTWQKVFEIDSEDIDAFEFLQQKHLEDKEHFYFTDDTPNEGKRYLAYPKTLVNISILGLLGCITFLFFSKSSEVLGLPQYSFFIAFFVFVISPWIGIIYVYCKSLRSITLSRDSIVVATRFRSYRYEWSAIEAISLSHSANPNFPDLNLVITPKDETCKAIVIDFNQTSSAIRARSYLISELGYFYDGLTFELWDSLSPKRSQYVRF